jgi:hypothetical protein
MLLPKIPEASPMPMSLQLLFFATGLVLALVGSFRSGNVRRQLDRYATHAGKTGARMPRNFVLINSLYSLGWTICWAIAFPSWWMRAVFGAISVFGVLVLLYRLDSLSSAAPPYDSKSTLELKSSKV